jgi:hypothetical protein
MSEKPDGIQPMSIIKHWTNVIRYETYSVEGKT